MNRIRWELRRLSVWIIRKCLVPLFRPIVWYIVFHDLLRRPDHLYYIRERTKLLDRFSELFGSATECTSRQQVYDLALRSAAEACLNGLWLEFGVWRGESINYIARKCRDRTIYGFDSFEGLPVDWNQGAVSSTTIPAAYFKVYELPRVRSNVVLVKGWFDKSLPEFLLKHTEPIAFMHIDSDVYESAKTIFDIAGDRIKRGTVIVFDEYFNYPKWEEGEYRAFDEHLKRSGKKCEFIAFNSHGEQAALIIC